MRAIILTLIFTSISLGLFSQDFEVPKDYKLDKAEDYAAYEADVINCFDWLMETPLNEQKAKRKEANAFLFVWLSGSPNVQIELKQDVVTFAGTSPDLMLIFMGGWAKYSLESQDFTDKVAANLAGIESVIEFYKANRKVMSKDKNVEKYIKMKDKGTLDEYIRENA